MVPRVRVNEVLHVPGFVQVLLRLGYPGRDARQFVTPRRPVDDILSWVLARSGSPLAGWPAHAGAYPDRSHIPKVPEAAGHSTPARRVLRSATLNSRQDQSSLVG